VFFHALLAFVPALYVLMCVTHFINIDAFIARIIIYMHTLTQALHTHTLHMHAHTTCNQVHVGDTMFLYSFSLQVHLESVYHYLLQVAVMIVNRY